MPEALRESLDQLDSQVHKVPKALPVHGETKVQQDLKGVMEFQDQQVLKVFKARLVSLVHLESKDLLGPVEPQELKETKVPQEDKDLTGHKDL